jgi:hypothetical protein
VLAPASPLANDERCPSLPALGSAEEWHLNLCPVVSYYVLAAAGPLAKDESYPPSLSAVGSAEEKHLGPLAATLRHGATAPVPTTAPGSAAYSSCLLHLPTTYPMDSNASVTQLSHPRLHRRLFHVSLVLLQEPRV